MARITPDSFDQLVYKLDETSGVYRNSGTLLPNNSATDLTITGTVLRTGTGVHATPCPIFPGTSSFPTGASATRNFIAGSTTAANIQAPFTASFWINQRSYVNNGVTQPYVRKLFRPAPTTTTFAVPFTAWEITNGSGNSGQDLFFAAANSATTQTSRTFIEFPMPIGQWSHIGMTHDGSNFRYYLNGCQLMQYVSGVQSLQLAAPSTGIVYNEVQYAVVQSTGTYVPGVDDIGNHGDEVMTTINLPFPFTFYGASYSTAGCSSNGFVTFGSTTNAFGFTLPNGSLGPLVNVCERDNTTSGGGLGIFTTTIGSAPNRTFIIEWRMNSLAGGTLNAEIKLFENSTTFETLYTTSTSVNTVSIGVQSNLGGKSTIFNNSTTIPAPNTKLTYTASNAFGPGDLVIGATPLYLGGTTPSTKEEANFMISDLRIANTARSLTYFQTVYKYGALPVTTTNQLRYYKLRAYDLSCSVPTPVTWVDTQISLANAPSLPCGGPYSPVEVLDTWIA